MYSKLQVKGLSRSKYLMRMIITVPTPSTSTDDEKADLLNVTMPLTPSPQIDGVVDKTERQRCSRVMIYESSK